MNRLNDPHATPEAKEKPDALVTKFSKALTELESRSRLSGYDVTDALTPFSGMSRAQVDSVDDETRLRLIRLCADVGANLRSFPPALKRMVGTTKDARVVPGFERVIEGQIFAMIENLEADTGLMGRLLGWAELTPPLRLETLQDAAKEIARGLELEGIPEISMEPGPPGGGAFMSGTYAESHTIEVGIGEDLLHSDEMASIGLNLIAHELTHARQFEQFYSYGLMGRPFLPSAEYKADVQNQPQGVIKDQVLANSASLLHLGKLDVSDPDDLDDYFDTWLEAQAWTVGDSIGEYYGRQLGQLSDAQTLPIEKLRLKEFDF